MLKKIYAEQKAANRNLQRMNILIMLMLFAKIGKDAKAQNDERGKQLSKIGLCLIVVLQGLMLIGDVLDFLKLKTEEEYEQDDE